MGKHPMNPKYKDSLFRMLFSDKKKLLSLYNAVSETDYTNEEDLEVNTLEGVIYLSMKNDISFIIGGELSLYEHQSTWCGNIPLRILLYVSDLYAGITADKNLFGSKTLLLPKPKFVVFYNGSKDIPDRSVQKLSDAFENQTYESIDSDIDLELMVTVLNINKGHNEELMSKCKSLQEYTIFVDRVRYYSKIMPVREAIEQAINECIKDDVLAGYLRKYREEVEHMSIYEFNQELYDEDLRDEGRATERVILIRKKLCKNLSALEIADMLELDVKYVTTIVQLIEEFPDQNNVEIAEKILHV